MENYDLEKLSPEERKELLKKKTDRKSSSPMGYIYPQRIREILSNTDINESTFKPYEKPVIIKVPKMPETCPECGKSSRHHLHIKFLKLRNKCFDCVLKEEHEIRLSGEWEEYENWVMGENKLAYFRDIKDEIDDYLNNGLKKVHQYVDANGSIEEWTNPNFEKDKIFIEDKRKELDEFLKNLEEEVIVLRNKFYGRSKKRS